MKHNQPAGAARPGSSGGENAPAAHHDSTPLGRANGTNELVPLAYTLADAAKAAGMSRSRLYALIGEGEIEARKVGRRTLILARSLAAYLDNAPVAAIGKNAAAARSDGVAPGA